jgi:hypothetical protein
VSLAAGTGEKVGDYVYFDGSTYFTLPSLGTLSNWTISTWFNPFETLPNYTSIVTSGTIGQNMNYYLGSHSGILNYVAYMISTDGADFTTSSFDLSQNKWTNVVATFNGSNFEIYLDGSNIGVSTTGALIGTYNASPTVSIGGNSGLSSCNVVGLLGEVQIYNYALTAADISQNYITTSNNYQDRLLLKLEASTYAGGSNWVDSSPNSNNATLATGTGQTSNGYVYFDGSTYFTAPNLGTLSNWTLSLWYKPFMNPVSDFIIFGEPYGTGGPSYSIIYSSNGFYTAPAGYAGFAIDNGSTRNTNGTQLTSNTWNNLVVTYDSSYMRLYLNNTLVSSNAASGAITTNGYSICIGGDTSPFAGRINGLLGEALIYGRALTAPEISFHYNLTASNYS